MHGSASSQSRIAASCSASWVIERNPSSTSELDPTSTAARDSTDAAGRFIGACADFPKIGAENSIAAHKMAIETLKYCKAKKNTRIAETNAQPHGKCVPDKAKASNSNDIDNLATSVSDALLPQQPIDNNGIRLRAAKRLKSTPYEETKE
jgi:hypothetical protein